MQKLPIVLLVTGVGFLLVAVLFGWVIVPNIIEDQITQQVQIRNGTEQWDKWKDIPLPVYLKFFIFNVTNPTEVERGAKPIFHEAGPYVYRETRRKEILAVSEDEEIITYRQFIDYYFEEELSAGTEDDIVTIINIPFAAVSRMVEKIPYGIRFLVNLYVMRFKEKLFIERTIGQLLFEGYYQPMLAEIQNITGQELIKDGKFGLYVGAVATMVSKINGQLANLIVNLLRLLSLGSESLLRRKIRLGDLTFNGFPIPYYAVPLEIISNLGPILNISAPELPPEFQNGRFGFYNGRNGSDDGVYEIYSGVKDTSKFGVIRTWNNKTNLDWWIKSPGDYCNKINGSDGSVFPPFVKKDRILRIFNVDICRSLYLAYEKEVTFMGIPGYRFTAPESLLQDPRINGDNLCFCNDPEDLEDGCLKAGAIHLSSCRDGAPVTMSTPHFYQASSDYLNQSIGLHPTMDLHQTFIDIEPNTGLPLQASKRIQINVELKKLSSLDAFKNVPEMLFPVLWGDESAALDEENADELKRMLVTPLKIVSISKWTILGVSSFLIAAGAGICFLRIRQKKHAYQT